MMKTNYVLSNWNQHKHDNINKLNETNRKTRARTLKFITRSIFFTPLLFLDWAR